MPVLIILWLELGYWGWRIGIGIGVRVRVRVRVKVRVRVRFKFRVRVSQSQCLVSLPSVSKLGIFHQFCFSYLQANRGPQIAFLFTLLLYDFLIFNNWQYFFVCESAVAR